jgi:hypothetical protein
MKICSRLLVVVLATLATCAVPFAQEGAPASPPSKIPSRDVSGFWELSFDSRNVPPAALAPGINAAVLAAQARKDANAIRWCHFLGMPLGMESARPIDIRQGRREVVINFEWRVTPRHLYLDRKAHISPDEFDPTTNGDSIAHWEGDTLVVDTVGFDGSKGVTAIPGGGFRTSDSHLVERYRLLKDGALLSVTFTWTDPKVFRTPHTYEFRYLRAPKFHEAQPPVACDPFDDERVQFLMSRPGESVR